MWHEPLQLSRKFAQKYILTVLNVFKPSVFGAPVRGTIEKFEQGNKKPSEVGLVAQKMRFLAATEDLPKENPRKALAETGFETQSESQGEYHGTRTYSFVRRSKPRPRHD